MIQRICLVIILLCILPDWYIYSNYIKHHFKQGLARFRYWLPTLLLLAFMTYLLQGNNFTADRVRLTAIFMTIFLLITVPKALFSLITLFFKLIHKVWKPANKVGMALGLTAALSSMGILFYGSFYGAYHYDVKEVDFESVEVPEAFDGYRIVQISDLHIGTLTGKQKELQKAVNLINAQKPDLIVFTGDLINNLSTELDGMQDILSKLHAPDGVYSVLGNHDYSNYYHWKSKKDQQANLADLKKREAAMGWQLLNNRNTLIQRGDTCIALCGVENDGRPPFPEKGDLFLATQGTDGMFKVLLSHDPTHWRRKVLPNTDIQLMLAGHTHAMQFELGCFSPATWFYKEWGGLYYEGQRGLYVNIGLGSVMLPFRFGAWPEITVITLKKNKRKS